MLHTLKEAIELTGKSRRTIYSHCSQGLLSYGVGADGRRYFDTAELIRVYGALHTAAHPEPEKTAHFCTPQTAHLDEPLTEATALRLIDAIERLVKLEEQKLLLLEHQPDPPSPPPVIRRPSSKSGTKAPASFADLLRSMDEE